MIIIGSSFTKAKPQHGFMKVARMATLRWLLMPFYANWWMRQTSGRFFSIILILYIVQMVNIVLYFVYTYTFSYSDFEVSLVPFYLGVYHTLLLSEYILYGSHGANFDGMVVKFNSFANRRHHTR